MKKASARGKATEDLGRVLVVEDDAILALAIEQVLRDGGASEVIVCSSTSEALAALRDEAPGTLVLDVHLADRDDGWAIAELVKEVGPRPPRIVFSTGAPRDIPEDIAELGAVLEKPYDPADLVALLKSDQRQGLFSRLRGALS